MKMKGAAVPMGANRKKQLAVAGLIAALLAGMVLFDSAVMKQGTGGLAMAAETQPGVSAERTITVSGTGKLTIDPDVAYVNFGVMTKAGTAQEAQSANAKTFAEISKVLKEQFKIPDNDVKTSGFYVHPEYQYSDKGEAKISGYVAEHTVRVTYRDLDGIGDLLDAVSKAGANRVNGIQFATEKSEMYELQAIELAMANAKAKAETIAKAAGRSVKGVLHVQQGSGSPQPIYVTYERISAAANAAYDAKTSVSPGQMEFTVTVTVVYEM